MHVIEIFKTICAIPHCSHHAQGLKSYILDEAKRFGYEVSSDKVGNILCSHPEARLILQAHYDMVCIGRAPELELYEENGWLKAKESSLGADNGIGVAMMLALMSEKKRVSCLFTADEEVGLLGAQGLELKIKETLMLNLDTEEEGYVYIGCAGGSDVIATQTLRFETIDEEVVSYEIVVDGLPGGHSGVDIHKNIPSAIKKLASYLVHIPHYLISIEGGERRNSIPRRARAVISVPSGVMPDAGVDGIQIIKLDACHDRMIVQGHRVSEMIHAFAQGVRAMNNELGIVQSSINLALIEIDEKEMRVTLSARSMDSEELLLLVDETLTFFRAFEFTAKSEGSYPAWKPELNDFALQVQNVCQKHFEKADFMAIHAGLECAVLKSHFPHLQIASIGPTIHEPHSSRESVQIASVQRVYRALEEIVRESM
ncbi:MAG: M20/M25/M40 family metallo-hydrolase [Campylobacterales bacterium]|nr:M20/M25/M40 family metallo-hydrolase [Campylobacterales bacterium]